MRRASLDEEEISLRAADELLQDDDRRSSLSSNTPLTSRRRSSIPALPPSSFRRTSPARLLTAYTAAVLLSTLSAHALVRVNHKSSAAAEFATLALPLTQYSALGVGAAAVGWVRPRGMFGAGGSGGGGGEGGRIAWAAGGAAALGLVLRLWEARLGDHRIAEALEVYTLPALLALLPYATSKFSNHHSSFASLATSPAPAFITAVAVATFLIGFALIGTATNGLGVALALVRVPVEAVGLILLKVGMGSGGQAGSFLKSAALSASVASVVLLPLSQFSSTSETAQALDSTAYVSLSVALLTSLAAQIALVSTLYLSESSSTTASALFPRNLLLLLWSTFGREGIPLRENWMQVGLVYGIGSAALLCTDSDVSTAVRELRNGGEGSNFLPLNGHALGSPTTSTSLRPASPPPNFRKSSDHHLPQAASRLPSVLTLVPFLPLLVFLIASPASTSSLSSACAYLPPSLRANVCPSSTLSSPISRTVDVVMSYYDEDLSHAQEHLHGILETEFVRRKSSRVVVYNKGEKSAKTLREGLKLRREDEVVALPNLGREGATYLKHILLHYNSTLSALSPSYRPVTSAAFAPLLSQLRTRTLADHTYFIQPHLAWPDIATPRLQLVTPSTGFAHFGPYVNISCGFEDRFNISFPIVKELFGIFAQQLCPPTGQTGAWSGQFVASKRRIMANPYARWAMVDEIMEAPSEHWIHDMWGPNASGGPSNPAVGHSIERSWPTMLGCWDRRLADECTDDVADAEKCQCWDT